jgi:kynureninase
MSADVTLRPAEFQAGEPFAREQDERDPLRRFRSSFHLPAGPDGRPLVYFCGNSLGLQPRAVRAMVEEELDAWARSAVDAHFHARHPWYSYHELFREDGARLVGARPGEVVMMNSLTVNLHLMMVSFFRPQGARRRILIEHPAFPSDLYAVRTHLRCRGIDPDEALLVWRPPQGEELLRTEDLERLLREQGETVALILVGGVNYVTGQVLDMPAICALGRRHGCAVGLDLAHAAGNVPLALHDWGPDFACWCSYKYLNAGPGAVAGCFVHQRHAARADLPRLAGWWGNDPETRFRMHLQPEFVPQQGAAGWQVSNPPILAMAPLRAALEVVHQAGLDAMRAKSLRLSGYLRWLIEHGSAGRYRILTPREPDARGCQISLQARGDARALFERLRQAGVVGDFREPGVIRVAPVPLYNTYHEVWRFAGILAQAGA